jgi:cell division protein FtsI/penicillin-binding protein 2
MINLLAIFLIILFLGLGKNSIGLSLLGIFLFSNTVRLVIKKSETMGHFNQRTYLFSFVMLILFTILGARLAQIQIKKHNKFYNLSENQSYNKYSLNGNRGNILDSKGRELAYDANIYKVIIDPKRF